MRDDLQTSPIIIDLETAGLPDAAQYLEPVVADRRLKDPIKIKQDILDKEEARLEKLALDPNVGRIVALGWWTAEGGLVSMTLQTELDEMAGIAAFWRACEHRQIVGFNVRGFDMRYLVQRSRYLSLPYPWLDLGRYAKRGGVIDLFSILTFDEGVYDQGAMKRSLGAFCKRFGLEHDDTVKGSDIPALVAKGDWDSILAHVTADVWATVQLARRLAVINTDVTPATWRDARGTPARV